MEEKLIISQDVRALITSIGAGRVQINVIQNVNTVRGGGSREVSTLSDLFDLISKVSGNRMHFLRDCLVDMVDKRFSSEDARANWIGITKRTLREWRTDKNKRAEGYYDKFEAITEDQKMITE